MRAVVSILGLFTLMAMAGCGDQAPTSSSPDDGLVAGKVVPGQYIVVLKPGVGRAPDVAEQLAKAHGGQVTLVYEHALQGFALQNLPEQAVAALQRNPNVAYVEPDRVREISAQTVPTGVQRIFADGNDEIDIDGTDDWRVDVDVAIIDTGIDFQHPDLNVVGGVNCVSRSFFSSTCSSGGDDDHYHGTHVAGTVGAIDNGIGAVGVAPGARLWAVKVLNSRGSGYSSWIVAGIDWVAANAATIEVANMSLGGAGFSQAEYDAIQGAVNAGVAFAVAAGNEDDDASNYSPGGFDNVLSVSALADFNGLPGGGAAATCRTDIDDTLADFSNWGAEIDIAAPGVCIYSTYPLEKGEYGTISGTSMASPHAAGALALLASRNNPASATDVYNLYNQVKSSGNDNWTDDSGDGTKEPLLDVSSTSVFNPVLVPGSGGGNTNQPPIASFTSTTSGLTVNFTDTSTDPDGAIIARSWAFGDGGTSTLQNPSHTYAADGAYTVSLTVTDDDGATDEASQAVTVASPPPPGGSITLSVTTRTAGSNKFADLRWSGATSANVDVYRGLGTAVPKLLLVTANDGVHSDKVPKTTTEATYKVCEAGTTTCSEDVKVGW